MPLVKIEIRKGKSDEFKKAILDGVHDALVKAIKIPDYDRFRVYMNLTKAISKVRLIKRIML